MKIDVFDQYKIENDPKNPFCDLYQLEEGERFYIETAFHKQLQRYYDQHKKDFPRIIEEMIRLVKKNKNIVFVGNFEFPQTEVDKDFIFLEITDVTDPLQIYAEDKSRGSDYGD